MNKVIVGKIVTSHGLDGKVKVISATNLKNKVFHVGNFLYLETGEKLEIISFQSSSKYEILWFKDYDNIDLISGIINQNISVDVDELNLEKNEYLEAELINAKVLEDGKILGIGIEILEGKRYNYLKVKGEKEFLIPLVDAYIIEFKRDKAELMVNDASQLII